MRVLTTNKLRYNQNSNFFGHIITYKYPISDSKIYILQKLKGQDWVHKPFFSLVIHETTIFLWFSEKKYFQLISHFLWGLYFHPKRPYFGQVPYFGQCTYYHLFIHHWLSLVCLLFLRCYMFHISCCHLLFDHISCCG